MTNRTDLNQSQRLHHQSFADWLSRRGSILGRPYQRGLVAASPSAAAAYVARINGCLRTRAEAVEQGHSTTHAPGRRMLGCLEQIFPRETFDTIVKPALLDMQYEHMETLNAGKPWTARWVLVRRSASVAAAILAQLPVSIIKLEVKLWKAAA